MYCVLHDIYTSLLSYERHTECVLVPEPKLHQKFTQRHTNTQIKSHKDCQCWITVKLLEVAFSFAANLFTFCSRKFTIKSIKSSTLLKLKVWLIRSCYQFLSVKWFTSKIIITSRAPFRFHFVWDWDETHCFCEKSNETFKVQPWSIINFQLVYQSYSSSRVYKLCAICKFSSVKFKVSIVWQRVYFFCLPVSYLVLVYTWITI